MYLRHDKIRIGYFLRLSISTSCESCPTKICSALKIFSPWICFKLQKKIPKTLVQEREFSNCVGTFMDTGYYTIEYMKVQIIWQDKYLKVPIMWQEIKSHDIVHAPISPLPLPAMHIMWPAVFVLKDSCDWYLDCPWVR